MPDAALAFIFGVLLLCTYITIKCSERSAYWRGHADGYSEGVAAFDDHINTYHPNIKEH